MKRSFSKKMSLQSKNSLGNMKGRRSQSVCPAKGDRLLIFKDRFFSKRSFALNQLYESLIYGRWSLFL